MARVKAAKRRGNEGSLDARQRSRKIKIRSDGRPTVLLCVLPLSERLTNEFLCVRLRIVRVAGSCGPATLSARVSDTVPGRESDTCFGDSKPGRSCPRCTRAHARDQTILPPTILPDELVTGNRGVSDP